MSGTDETMNVGAALVDEVLAIYGAACDAGAERGLLRRALMAGYPELAEGLRAFFENEGQIITSGLQLLCFGDDLVVLEEIGRGGMGVVYKVHQKGLNTARS